MPLLEGDPLLHPADDDGNIVAEHMALCVDGFYTAHICPSKLIIDSISRRKRGFKGDFCHNFIDYIKK